MKNLKYFYSLQLSNIKHQIQKKVLLIIKMYDSQKYNNNHRTHYYSLAQKFQPKLSYTSILKTQEPNHPLTSSYQQAFTFSKDFYSSQHVNTAYRSQKLYPKYRSSSLSSQCLVKNLNTNHFSYYDQLKRRDFIVIKNCRSFSDLKNNLVSSKEKSFKILNNQSLTSVLNADVKRFSKFNADKKLTNSNNGPFVRTNVIVFEKPDKNNRFTQIKSIFQPSEISFQNQKEKNKAKRQNQVPIIDCTIEVKSDDDERYYSTVQSQHPAILTNHQTFYDEQNQIFTTEATLIKQFSYSFDNLNKPQVNLSRKKIQNPFMQYSNLHKKTKQSKYFDSFIIKEKKIQVGQERNTTQKLKRPQGNKKKKFEFKNSIQNVSVQNKNPKYHYSKYFLGQKEAKNQYKSIRQSARKDNKSEKKQRFNLSLTNHKKHANQTKNAAEMNFCTVEKSLEQFSRFYQTNNTSSQLLMQKK